MRAARAARRPASAQRSAGRRQTIYAILFVAAGLMIALGLYFTPNHKRMRGWDEADLRYALAYYALVLGSVTGAGVVIAMIIDPSRRPAPQQSNDDGRRDEPEPDEG